jgi:hypothetical protein
MTFTDGNGRCAEGKPWFPSYAVAAAYGPDDPCGEQPVTVGRCAYRRAAPGNRCRWRVRCENPMSE